MGCSPLDFQSAKTVNKQAGRLENGRHQRQQPAKGLSGMALCGTGLQIGAAIYDPRPEKFKTEVEYG